MPFKFVHAADLHVDSPLRGLERYEGAPVAELRGASRRAVGRLVDLCLDEAADFLLIAGDVFDGDWRDYSTGLFFAAQMQRLREAGVPVFLVRGNHDAASHVTRTLRLPANVRELDPKRPETVMIEELGVAVHGQGFATKAVTDDLAARYPHARSGLFNIGLLHTSLDGREGHASYAPTTLEMMRAKGYDYWALGHVHRREIVSEAPFVVFPGNLQGRTLRESGPKGATLVTVDGGRVVSAEHRAVDVARWERVEIDAAAAASADDVVDLARLALERAAADADGRVLAARLVVRGATRAHAALAEGAEKWTNELRAAANEAGGAGVWLEKLELATAAPGDLHAVGEDDGALGKLVRSLRAVREDEAALADLARVFDDLRAKLPRADLDDADDDALFRLDAGTVRDALDDVERLVLPALLSGDEP